MSANSHCRPRFPPVEFADRLEAWGAASLFGGFKLLPLDFASALGGTLARRIGSDASEGFRKLAARAGFEERTVPTL
jgi:hypothetical protein